MQRDTSRNSNFRPLQGHKGAVLCCSGYGEFVITAGHDKKIIVWWAETGKLNYEIDDAHDHIINALDVSYRGGPEVVIVSGSWDKTCKVWSLISGDPLTTFSEHRNRVKCIKVLVGEEVPPLRLGHEIHQRREEEQSPPSSTRNLAKAVSGDDDGNIFLWSVVDGNCILKMEDHCRYISAMILLDEYNLIGHGDASAAGERVFHSAEYDGCQLVTASADCTIRMWDLESNAAIKVIKTPSKTLSSLALLVVESDSYLLQADQHQQHRHQQQTTSSPYSSAHSATSSSLNVTIDTNCLLRELLVITGDHGGSIYLYRAKTKSLLYRLETHSKIISLLTSDALDIPLFPSANDMDGFYDDAVVGDCLSGLLSPERRHALGHASAARRAKNHKMTTHSNSSSNSNNSSNNRSTASSPICGSSATGGGNTMNNTLTSTPTSKTVLTSGSPPAQSIERYLFYIPDNGSIGAFNLSSDVVYALHQLQQREGRQGASRSSCAYESNNQLELDITHTVRPELSLCMNAYASGKDDFFGAWSDSEDENGTSAMSAALKVFDGKRMNSSRKSNKPRSQQHRTSSSSSSSVDGGGNTKHIPDGIASGSSRRGRGGCGSSSAAAAAAAAAAATGTDSKTERSLRSSNSSEPVVESAKKNALKRHSTIGASDAAIDGLSAGGGSSSLPSLHMSVKSTSSSYCDIAADSGAHDNDNTVDPDEDLNLSPNLRKDKSFSCSSDEDDDPDDGTSSKPRRKSILVPKGPTLRGSSNGGVMSVSIGTQLKSEFPAVLCCYLSSRGSLLHSKSQKQCVVFGARDGIALKASFQFNNRFAATDRKPISDVDDRQEMSSPAGAFQPPNLARQDSYLPPLREFPTNPSSGAKLSSRSASTDPSPRSIVDNTTASSSSSSSSVVSAAGIAPARSTPSPALSQNEQDNHHATSGNFWCTSDSENDAQSTSRYHEMDDDEVSLSEISHIQQYYEDLLQRTPEKQKISHFSSDSNSNEYVSENGGKSLLLRPHASSPVADGDTGSGPSQGLNAPTLLHSLGLNGSPNPMSSPVFSNSPAQQHRQQLQGEHEQEENMSFSSRVQAMNPQFWNAVQDAKSNYSFRRVKFRPQQQQQQQQQQLQQLEVQRQLAESNKFLTPQQVYEHQQQLQYMELYQQQLYQSPQRSAGLQPSAYQQFSQPHAQLQSQSQQRVLYHYHSQRQQGGGSALSNVAAAPSTTISNRLVTSGDYAVSSSGRANSGFANANQYGTRMMCPTIDHNALTSTASAEPGASSQGMTPIYQHYHPQQQQQQQQQSYQQSHQRLQPPMQQPAAAYTQQAIFNSSNYSSSGYSAGISHPTPSSNVHMMQAKNVSSSTGPRSHTATGTGSRLQRLPSTTTTTTTTTSTTTAGMKGKNSAVNSTAARNGLTSSSIPVGITSYNNPQQSSDRPRTRAGTTSQTRSYGYTSSNPSAMTSTSTSSAIHNSRRTELEHLNAAKKTTQQVLAIPSPLPGVASPTGIGTGSVRGSSSSIGMNTYTSATPTYTTTSGSSKSRLRVSASSDKVLTRGTMNNTSTSHGNSTGNSNSSGGGHGGNQFHHNLGSVGGGRKHQPRRSFGSSL
eukprot:CAMPEP_0174960564 /NCGR_PEP_ID=MMETSP0004_2-20121128/3769_1 /TAXON_ID=420556 /ORGANISM="Ochromonas sp., Strain CCMP1393" /LENGTH=1587 /DNA_ID=CAMNT_0016208941 /DNA_START=23 /DNA_END=4785 /DNA_ORIENTATION=+